MEKVTVTISDPIGLHARPASQISKVAAKFKSDIKISTTTNSANAKSLLNIMSLAAKQGQEITLEANGEDEKEAIEKLVETLEEANLISR
ncbi:HPr family phosphocarrier protein [Mesomycoplasma lagogenitalium]|uniref:Phosphocarrier protein HPr n=1 Tax=Mesomycoplasma lagogenitalium TaxID=171286 RepID=A0ABY8LVQ7_9BACT|nr:HPr family phosphocarrier protein [Mesomycoplasma lagogenitalium]WGI36341.1 HPr family phosphocarrier protein [Mesomycoplasma lagogenitalium]